jgi:hypothetical protein
VTQNRTRDAGYRGLKWIFGRCGVHHSSPKEKDRLRL